MDTFDLNGDNRVESLTGAVFYLLGLLCWTTLALVLAAIWMAYMMSGILDAERFSVVRPPAISKDANQSESAPRSPTAEDRGVAPLQTGVAERRAAR